jgi:hypothetical protein
MGDLVTSLFALRLLTGSPALDSFLITAVIIFVYNHLSPAGKLAVKACFYIYAVTFMILIAWKTDFFEASAQVMGQMLSSVAYLVALPFILLFGL